MFENGFTLENLLHFRVGNIIGLSVRKVPHLPMCVNLTLFMVLNISTFCRPSPCRYLSNKIGSPNLELPCKSCCRFGVRSFRCFACRRWYRWDRRYYRPRSYRHRYRPCCRWNQLRSACPVPSGTAAAVPTGTVEVGIIEVNPHQRYYRLTQR